MRAPDYKWERCAQLAQFDFANVVEILGSSEGAAPDDGSYTFNAQWWLLARMHDGRYIVLWGDDGATCGPFQSNYAEAEVRSYTTEAEARASIPVDVELT